jgi:hypothetical protein
MVVVIVIVTVIVMLSVLVTLLIHVIVILLFDCDIDITTSSIVNGAGNCIIHNRSHKHVNSDRNYIIAVLSIHIYITTCYQQQHASIVMTMIMTMTMACIEKVIVLVLS